MDFADLATHRLQESIFAGIVRTVPLAGYTYGK